MPDITMCHGGECPKKETCYRFKAKPTPNWQSWFMGVPWDGEKCESYWEVISKSEMKRLNVQTGRGM